MIALGVVILVVVALASLVVVFRGGEIVHIDLHWFTIKTTAGIVFLAGAVALALVVLGLSLIWEGLKRVRRRRKETKRLRQRAAVGEAAVNAEAASHPSSTAGQPPSAGPTPTTKADAPSSDDHFDTTPRDR